MYTDLENNRIGVTSEVNKTNKDGLSTQTFTLRPGYAANAKYYFTFECDKGGTNHPELVTAAYVGDYSSIGAAKAAGASDIKDTLFASGIGTGYLADYSKGVYFTIFVGEDGADNQQIFRYCIITKEGSIKLSGDTMVEFYGLCDAEGQPVDAYVVDRNEDSYADYNYLTMFVGSDTDLTRLAPTFAMQEGAKLYAEGSSSPEVSGVSLHDFSDGPVQYSASAENKIDSKNYWLHIVKAEEGEGTLYINSLSDEHAETSEDGGVTYSTREIFIDTLHDYVHDILLANIGTGAVPALSVELKSDVVELDDYWTLSGSYDLEGLTTIESSTSHGELPNLAKIRLKAKDGVWGQDASGTLTIKSGGKALIVLTLTGTVGDPTITTKEIPAAVKYVPYGTMIQNSNKYQWNKVSYQLMGGKLPSGMEVKKSGEIYGVPRESGEFTFTVQMTNSERRFGSSNRTYTLVVNENTDYNVEMSTDPGYDVTQRVQNVTLDSTADQTFVSQGVYGEFVDIFLDGEKLAEGVDYSSESGSTRITIRSQTLKASNVTGTHTLGVEFRTSETNSLKRAAQNYKVIGKSGHSDSDSDNSNSYTSTTNTTSNDSKKGVVNPQTGIVTGTGKGYSQWQRDENGWKLIYADGTVAKGQMMNRDDGTTFEQVAWEKVNGAWYAFGSDGYLKSGWICDYQLGAWYYMTEERGIISGWFHDPEDNCTYYLDPETAKLVTGWKQIDGNWYYFYDVVATPTWYYNAQLGTWVYNILSKNTPYGSLFRSERTPDGFYVNADGVWDGKRN